MSGRRRAAIPGNSQQGDVRRFEAQPKQAEFFASAADVVIYGGQAGGGKTFALLLEAARHQEVKGFNAVIFRRTSEELKQAGGIWEESGKVYPHFGARSNLQSLTWTFPSGAYVRFDSIQYESDLPAWGSSQICLICYDELTTFTEKQFWFLMARNRSTCGVRPYIRAGCNPDPDSFVAQIVEWWINQETGYPIPERSGVVRWFVRKEETIHWADSREQLVEECPEILPRSLTFIPSSVFDNRILIETDPGYLANLQSLPLVERERLLGGNWKIRPASGKVFNRDWFKLTDVIPGSLVRVVRFFDMAATEKELAKKDPDYTAGLLMGELAEGGWIVLDLVAGQCGPADVETLFLTTARDDARQWRDAGIAYSIRWEIEPGSAGLREAWRLTSLLAGIDAEGVSSRGDKLERARAFAVQVQARNVFVLRREWAESFLRHMHAIPEGPHDDFMDAATGAFNALTGGGVGVYV